MSDRGTLRGEAHFRANNTYGDYIAIVLTAADAVHDIPPVWHLLDFRNRHFLDVWFRDTSGLPDRFVYIAAFDKTTPDWLVEAPVAELHGAGATGGQPPIGQVVHTDLPSIRSEAAERANEFTTGYLWVGVTLGKGRSWSTVPFLTKQQLLDWFASEVPKVPATYEYIAIFDKTDPRWASEGSPIADQWAGRRVIRASGSLNGRGQYGDRHGGRAELVRRDVRVAGLVDEVKLKQLTAEFDALYRTLVDQVKTNPEWSNWFVGIEPIFKGWFAFRKGIGDSIDPVSYRIWSDQLTVIRESAKSRQMKTPVSIRSVALVGGIALLGVTAIVAAVATRSRS